MDHADHVRLIHEGVRGTGLAWADVGAGSGAFTLALADVLGPDAVIVAVDKDAKVLRSNAAAMGQRFPAVRYSQVLGDFTDELELPELDGIVMANSLHFETDQDGVVAGLKTYLRPGGRFVVVEYNLQEQSFAVPHPVPFARWERLARHAGFGHTQVLVRRPSRFGREIYSAVSW